jgi:hypothetical protein
VAKQVPDLAKTNRRLQIVWVQAYRADLGKTLCKAIRSKTRVRLHCKNEIYFRTFEPYILYRAQTGKILVHCMQTQDDSNRARGKDLQSFDVRLLNSVILIKETFGYYAAFTSFKPKLGIHIICAVDSPCIYWPLLSISILVVPSQGSHPSI